MPLSILPVLPALPVKIDRRPTAELRSIQSGPREPVRALDLLRQVTQVYCPLRIAPVSLA